MTDDTRQGLRETIDWLRSIRAPWMATALENSLEREAHELARRLEQSLAEAVPPVAPASNVQRAMELAFVAGWTARDSDADAIVIGRNACAKIHAAERYKQFIDPPASSGSGDKTPQKSEKT